MDANKLEQYFLEYVFNPDKEVMEQNQTVIVDNASIGKAYEISWKNKKKDAVEDWLLQRFDDNSKSKDPDEKVTIAQLDYQNNYSKSQAEGGTEGMSKTDELQWLKDFIEKHDLRRRRLVELGRLYTCDVMYLPQHFFECNPVEGIWRAIKPRYLSLSREIPWRERLQRAYDETMTEELQKKLVSESIAFCRDS